MIERFRDYLKNRITHFCDVSYDCQKLNTLTNVSEAFERYVKEHEPESPWLPIEGAPKDGTRVMVYNDELAKINAVQQESVGDEDYYEPYAIAHYVHHHGGGGFWEDSVDDNLTHESATHYMPLPLPPKEAGT